MYVISVDADDVCSSDIKEIYRQLAEAGITPSTATLTTTFMIPRLEEKPKIHYEPDIGTRCLLEHEKPKAEGDKPLTVDEAKVETIEPRDKNPFDCGCGHPECDCLSPNPTGKCGCKPPKTKPKTYREHVEKRAVEERADARFSPACAVSLLPRKRLPLQRTRREET